jgi:D-3-phosphoglycerate dehydrogenase
MQLLIADAFPEAARGALAALGLHVRYEPELSAEALVGALGEAEILVVRGTKVTAQAFDAARALALVVRAGAGVNTIDVASANRLGVYVANCPGQNAIAVAELAFGMMLALDRRLVEAHRELAGGRWNKREYAKAQGLFGRRLGVVGVGQIGRELIRRAQAFGLHVIGWSRSLDEAAASELGIERAPSLDALASAAEIVSLHLPSTLETRGLIGKSFFARLRHGALLVNTARGGIVDPAALMAAIEGRALRYATDVFDDEPASAVADYTNPVLGYRGVLGTPHIGASTEQAQDAVADETVRIVTEFIRQGRVPNCVNLATPSPAGWQLNVRHYDRVGVLAAVLGALREAGINVQEVENVVFEGAKAATARIRLDLEPPPALLEKLAVIEHVIAARLIAL